MAKSDASNDADLVQAINYSHISNDNRSEPILPPIINSYLDDNRYWGLSSHDIPILIGAAAGAIGLIIIFLAAALIWHCCQFALQREKSSYSLDNDSERNSVSSHGSSLYINPESAIIVEEKSVVSENSDQNMKRSISAPLTRENFAPLNNTRIPVIKSQGLSQTNRPYSNMFACADSYVIKNVDENINQNQEHSIALELNVKEDLNESNHHRSFMYAPNHNISSDITSLKSRSLPWAQTSKRRTANSGDDSGEHTAKVNYSKKRKNRMRNDSAAAIAMNRSGTNPTNKPMISHKDTDTLVDNEAVVVYDERTAL